jgi:hypothetical protein
MRDIQILSNRLTILDHTIHVSRIATMPNPIRKAKRLPDQRKLVNHVKLFMLCHCQVDTN